MYETLIALHSEQLMEISAPTKIQKAGGGRQRERERWRGGERGGEGVGDRERVRRSTKVKKNTNEANTQKQRNHNTTQHNTRQDKTRQEQLNNAQATSTARLIFRMDATCQLALYKPANLNRELGLPCPRQANVHDEQTQAQKHRSMTTSLNKHPVLGEHL